MAPEFDMKKVTTPLLLHMLGKELRFPRLFLLCAVKVHFTSGCKSRPRNCRCTSVAIGRGHGAKATVVLEAPRQKASERGLSKHAGRNASEA